MGLRWFILAIGVTFVVLWVIVLLERLRLRKVDRGISTRLVEDRLQRLRSLAERELGAVPHFASEHFRIEHRTFRLTVWHAMTEEGGRWIVVGAGPKGFFGIRHVHSEAGFAWEAGNLRSLTADEVADCDGRATVEPRANLEGSSAAIRGGTDLRRPRKSV